MYDWNIMGSALAIFGNLQIMCGNLWEMFGNVCLTFWPILGNLLKPLASGWKSSENRHKCWYVHVLWTFYIIKCEIYLVILFFQHSKINFLSLHSHVTTSIYKHKCFIAKHPLTTFIESSEKLWETQKGWHPAIQGILNSPPCLVINQPFSGHQHQIQCSTMQYNTRNNRKCGRVVRAPDLKSVGCGPKSRLADVAHGSPSSTSQLRLSIANWSVSYQLWFLA